MLRFIPLLSCALLLLSAHVSFAETGFLYQRSELRVLRQNPPALPALPWQSEAPTEAARAPAAIQLEVDIRDASSLYRQEGWFQFGKFADQFGMLFVFGRAQPATLDNTPIYTPLDVLWVDAEGFITQIIPAVILADLGSPISSNKAVKAMMFMNGGECTRLHITPGDRMVGIDAFEPPPPMVLEMEKEKPYTKATK